MAIFDDLFLSILSMDAYNRGYRVGLAVVGGEIGTATIGIADDSTAAQAVDFFAQSYTWNGKKVISYRGTDSNAGNSGLGYDGDAANGYGLAIGSYAAAQADLAGQFYRSVTCVPYWFGPRAVGMDA